MEKSNFLDGVTAFHSMFVRLCGIYAAGILPMVPRTWWKSTKILVMEELLVFGFMSAHWKYAILVATIAGSYQPQQLSRSGYIFIVWTA